MTKIFSGFDVREKQPIDKRMVTDDLNNIELPYNGLLTYQQSDNSFYVNQNGSWLNPFKSINDNIASILSSLNGKVNKDSLAINVKDYGAKGDGITNDTDAFINALIYLKNNGGGTLKVSDGTYIVSGEIPIYSNTSIIGNGYGSKIKIKNNLPDTSMRTIFWVKDNEKNVNISNLYFDGNADNQSGTIGVVLFGGIKASFITVTNCHFYNNYGAFCIFSNCKYVKVLNNIFDTTKHDNTGVIFVADINDSNKYYICNSVFANNLVMNTTADGITISGNSPSSLRIENVNIENNVFYNCGNMSNDVDGASIYVLFTKYININNNNIFNTVANGIDIATGDFIKVSDNIVDRSGSVGILMDSINYGNISNNTITNSVQKGQNDSFNSSHGFTSGIAITSYNKNVTINDNNITDNQQTKTQVHAIRLVADNNEDIFIYNNNMSGNIDGLNFYAPQTKNLKMINNIGYNYRGFGLGNKSLPVQTGSSGKVQNTEPVPVTIYIEGGSGVAITDIKGFDKQLKGDPKVVILQPYEYIYFNTTLPTNWDWYGM